MSHKHQSKCGEQKADVGKQEPKDDGWGGLKLSADAQHVTCQLEQGHTGLLEEVLREVDTQEKREAILKVVQGINAGHLIGDKTGLLPKLEFEKSGAWPFAGGDDLVVWRTTKDSKNKEIKVPIYAEDDYQGDDNKTHRRIMDHHP